jgi:hypothetical protein
VDTPPPSEEPLSRRQLLERRLAAVDRLSAIYEDELWQLFDELRLRHAQFSALPGASVWKRGGRSGGGEDAAQDVQMADASAAEGDCPQGSSTVDSLRELWQQRRAERQAAAAAAPPAKQQAGREEAAGERVASSQQQQQQQREEQQQTDKEQQQEERQQAGAPPPPPRFEDVEALLLSGGAAALPPPDPDGLLEARQGFVRRLALVGRLEQGALGALCRELDALGGLALLAGRRARFVLRRAAVALGRCTESRGKVRPRAASACMCAFLPGPRPARLPPPAMPCVGLGPRCQPPTPSPHVAASRLTVPSRPPFPFCFSSAYC